MGALSWLAVSVGAAAPSEQRGFVSDGIAGGLLFQRCEAAGPAASQRLLLDQSPGSALTAGVAEVRQVMLDGERPLYVEFMGEADGKAMAVRQFRRAVGHVASCAAAPPVQPASVRLLVQGVQGDGGVQAMWRLVSSPAGARLEMPGKKPMLFQPVVLTATDAVRKARSFTARPAPGGAALRLDVVEQACHDSASETAYGATVVAHVGSQRLEGCAARF